MPPGPPAFSKTVIKRKSFSFLLARRYLNPRRAVLSSFTLISLIGVMLGVLVLVVVMAVYAGLERSVKNRLLGFTPHILLHQSQRGMPMNDWEETLKRAERIPHVEEATAFISDNVILDVDSTQDPVLFRGVDSTKPSEIKGIADMLDHENYPGSSADLGIDDRIVISSNVANNFGIGVGAKVKLYSTRNFEGVMEAYKVTENPPIHLHFADDWKKAKDTITAGWQEKDGKLFLKLDAAEEAYTIYEKIYSQDIREPEREMLAPLFEALGAKTDEADTADGLRVFTKESKTTIEKEIAAIEANDAEKMDGEILKGLKKLVLPKEAEVIGVYAASQMTVTPDLFMPLHLAQDLAGLQDGVQGIALRLTDPYLADQVAAESRRSLGPEWAMRTWGEQYSAFFALINQQRVMMYFALSFIVLVSAFSMMAVMFTVTIQKRREIGVMKALGAAPGQIVRVFLYQGMILGLLGAVLGVGLGRLVILFRGEIQVLMRHIGFDPFTASFTGFNKLPAHNNPLEQLMIAVMAFVLCSLAALVPAFFAARSDAAKSLRNL